MADEPPPRDHRRRSRLPTFWLALAVAIAACQSAPLATPAGSGAAAVTPAPGTSEPQGSAPGGPGPGGPGVDAARAAIDAADFADPASIAAVDAIRFTDAGASAAAQAIQAGATGDALWAAVVVYATGGTDAAVLLPILTDEDSTVRTLAAAALLSWGKPEAAAVLGASLSDESQLRGSMPPVTIAEFAAGTLTRYVDGPAIAPGAATGEVAAAWTAWLSANGAAMQFDPVTLRWATP